MEVSHPVFICFVSRELCPTCWLLIGFRLRIELASLDSPEERRLIESGIGQLDSRSRSNLRTFIRTPKLRRPVPVPGILGPQTPGLFR